MNYIVITLHIIMDYHIQRIKELEEELKEKNKRIEELEKNKQIENFDNSIQALMKQLYARKQLEELLEELEKNKEILEELEKNKEIEKSLIEYLYARLAIRRISSCKVNLNA